MAMGPEEKKKAFLLAGLAGLLGIGGLAVLRPWAGSGDATTTAVGPPPGAPGGAGSADGVVPPPGAPPGAPSGGPPSGFAGGTPPIGGAAPAPISAVKPQFVAAEKFRDDPFTPFYTGVLPPVPEPPPAPTPRPRPTPLPPVVLPSASDFGRDNPYNNGRTELPSFPGSNTRSRILTGLPQARVSRLVNAPTAPRVTSAPSSPGGASAPLERSSNKRLAGVAIGDSVRALLEVQDATTGEFRTYIVQPGQRVDAENLQVLRIERTVEGGQTRVRMIVRENGETRIVDLREGARPDLVSQNAGSGGEGGYPGGAPGGGFPGGAFPGGAPGFPGGAPGFPGAPGGFPGAAAPPGFPGGRPGFGGG